MNKKDILVVTNPASTNNGLHEWVKTTDTFEIKFADGHEKAIELAHQQVFELVLVDTTDELINDKKLKAVLPVLNADVLFVQYRGEAAQELQDKIARAFDKRKHERMTRLHVLDAMASEDWNNLPVFSAN